MKTRDDRNLEHVRIDAIHGYDRNARTHTKKQINLIVRSIEEFGFMNPLLIDEHGVIIAGHARLEAAMHRNRNTSALCLRRAQAVGGFDWRETAPCLKSQTIAL